MLFFYIFNYFLFSTPKHFFPFVFFRLNLPFFLEPKMENGKEVGDYVWLTHPFDFKKVFANTPSQLSHALLGAALRCFQCPESLLPFCVTSLFFLFFLLIFTIIYF